MKNITFTTELSDDGSIVIPNQLQLPKGKVKVTVERVTDENEQDYSPDIFLNKWSGILEDASIAVEEHDYKYEYLKEKHR